jgi:hypothetical protein
MPWSTEFVYPVTLKDGRSIATLEQARELMLSIPTPHRGIWRYAARFLREAAAGSVSLSDAEKLLTRALEAKGLI